VCLANGSVPVDECTPNDYEEARSSVRGRVEEGLLDQLIATTGRSRANAGRALTAADKRKGGPPFMVLIDSTRATLTRETNGEVLGTYLINPDRNYWPKEKEEPGHWTGSS